VAAVYAVVAWLLIQVADVVLPTFGAPDWVNQTLIFLFILGFPIAVILSWAYEVTPEGISSDPGVQAQAQVPAPQNQPLIYAIFVLVLLVAGFNFSDRFFSNEANSAIRSAGSGPGSANSTVVRASIILNQALQPMPGLGVRAALWLAPDDSALAYTSWANGRWWLRDLATQQTQEFEGEVVVPIFSPNSQNLLIAETLTGKYSIMSAQGGGLQPLPIETNNRAIWLSDEAIVYAHVDGDMRIFSLADETDEPVPNFVAQGESGILVSVPQRSAFLFQKSSILRAQNQLDIQLYDLDSQSTALVTTNGYWPQYANSGHVLFIRGGDLWAVPFDLDALKVTGSEARILEGVESQGDIGGAAYSVSDSGRLIYLPGRELFSNQSILVWADRSGNREELPLPAGNYAEPRISPDGELLALVSRQVDGSTDIWVYDFSRDTFGPRTFSGNALNPVWDAEGLRLFYQQTSVLAGLGASRGDLWAMNADGTGQAERILDATAVIDSFSQSDEKLIYTSYDGDANSLIGQLNTLTFSDDAWVSAPLLDTDFATDGGTVSPDGRWIAYTSSESDNYQVYVRPYPNLDGGRWLISNQGSGGVSPSWGPDSDELFFLQLDGTLMRTEITIEGDSFLHGRVETLITDLEMVTPTASPNYSISNDGERVLHTTGLTVDAPDTGLDQGRTELIMVENFFEELRRLAPPDPQ